MRVRVIAPTLIILGILPTATHAAVLYTTGPVFTGLPGNRSNESDSRQAADDFTLLTASTLTSARWYGSTFLDFQPQPTTFRIQLFLDDPNRPGPLAIPEAIPSVLDYLATPAIVATAQSTNVGQVLRYDVDLPSVSLAEGVRYWLSILAVGPSGNWLWDNASPTGYVAGRSLGANGPGDWDTTTNRTMAFELSGTPRSVPEPSTALLLLLGVVTARSVTSRRRH
jgi:hypothetical protein